MKRKWSQNFLFDRNIARKLISYANLNRKDTVLEIGPGKGILTQEIIPYVKRVFAIEIDSGLIDILQSRFFTERKLVLINSDFLKTDLGFLKKFSPLKVISSIPYSISTPIIFKLFTIKWESAILLLQKELAYRIVAVPYTKDYGALSVNVQYHCKVEIVRKISRNVFYPRPNVDSAIVRFTPIKRKLKVIDENLFSEIVKKAFSQRRKKIVNSLSSIYSIPKERLRKLLNSINISTEKRADQLTINDYITLTNAYSKK